MIVNLTLSALTDELIAQGAVNLEGRSLEKLKLYLDPADKFFSKSPNMTGAEIADMAINNGRPVGWREPRPTHALVAAPDNLLVVIEEELRLKGIRPVRYFQNT